MTSTERWHLKGQYFENCNCEILCPCVLPLPTSAPTAGHCDVGLVFHIDQGEFQGLDLAGFNFVIVAYTPGVMGAGNWTTALYVDEAASEQQRRALGRILSGEIGGPMARFMPLTTDFRGTKYCRINFEAKGSARHGSIEGVMDFNVEGIKAGRRRGVMRLENAGHPVNSTLALARGTNSSYTDHGMSWDNTGKNAHYSSFDWQWP